MGLIDLASEASRRRGYDYYVRGKVMSCRQTDKERYEGLVSGSGENIYQVAIDLEHPRSSQCSCPYAADRQTVCKHMVAMLYCMEQLWPEITEDRDDKLTKKISDYSSDEVDLALKFAIDIHSMRCTALLLNRSKGEERYSPDEFTLDDLPEEYGQYEKQEKQGNNDALLFLYPDAAPEIREKIRKKYGLSQ